LGRSTGDWAGRWLSGVVRVWSAVGAASSAARGTPRYSSLKYNIHCFPAMHSYAQLCTGGLHSPVQPHTIFTTPRHNCRPSVPLYADVPTAPLGRSPTPPSVCCPHLHRQPIARSFGVGQLLAATASCSRLCRQPAVRSMATSNLLAALPNTGCSRLYCQPTVCDFIRKPAARGLAINHLLVASLSASHSRLGH